MRALATQLRKHPFSGEQKDGFIIERVRPELIEGRYVERVDYKETIVDPFGNQIEFDRLEFRQCEFRAASVFPGLELINAPRSMQGIIARFIEVNNFSVTLSPLSLDVLQWATCFQQKITSNSVVDSIQVGNLELAKGIYATAILKGEHDVRESALLFTHGKPHKTDKLQLRMKNGNSGTIIMTSTGCATIDANGYDEIVSSLRDALVECTV